MIGCILRLELLPRCQNTLIVESHFLILTARCWRKESSTAKKHVKAESFFRLMKMRGHQIMHSRVGMLILLNFPNGPTLCALAAMNSPSPPNIPAGCSTYQQAHQSTPHLS